MPGDPAAEDARLLASSIFAVRYDLIHARMYPDARLFKISSAVSAKRPPGQNSSIASTPLIPREKNSASGT